MPLSSDIWLTALIAFVLLIITFSLEWGTKSVISSRDVISKIGNERGNPPKIFKQKVNSYLEDFYDRGFTRNWGVDLALAAFTIDIAAFAVWMRDPSRFPLPNLCPSFIKSDPTDPNNSLIFWLENFFFFAFLLTATIILKSLYVDRNGSKKPLRFTQFIFNYIFKIGLDDSTLIEIDRAFLNFFSYLAGIFSLGMVLYFIMYVGGK